MCGIVGIFDTRGQRPIDRDLLARMRDAMSHRGPDDAGLHFAPGIGLGHRRLSIIDLSPLGHQPLFNEDGTVCVTYNGEIYNYLDLFEQLQARGHKFRSRCDTEVIVHAWEEWGEDCVKHFVGQFAFAVWDEPKQTLFLARDRFGEKPLYYALLDDGQLIFGSVPDPRSIYRRVAKLPPAQSLTLRRGTPVPAPREYWDVRFAASDSPRNEAALCEELVERLRTVVGARMMADVPLGAFLSGGVDSSAVVAMMASVSNAPVNTCSISFDERSYDESQYAQQVAQRFHTKHFSRAAAVHDFDLLDRLVTFYDEPFADS